MSSCNRINAVSREAYERSKTEHEGVGKQAFANSEDSAAKENMTADTFVMTCGTCRFFDIKQMPHFDACTGWEPRTDSWEKLARDMYAFIGSLRMVVEPIDEFFKASARMEEFRERLSELGIEVE